MFSSFSSIFYSKWIGKDNYSSHGASGKPYNCIYIFTYSLFDTGAIYSVVSMLACVAPKMTFQLYGFIPVPAWLAITGLFTYDLYSTMSNTVSRSIFFLIIGIYHNIRAEEQIQSVISEAF